jgi:lipid II:glycine glycyltransferase (peptidoglycan interpeptide bridge formation enzyme)
LVWHAYVTSGTTARLQHSGSYFRNKENDYRALVGRANRWLHWRTMLRFKEMGMERYDWGGLFEDESVPERAGINNFKRSFGGQQERTYDCTLPVTFKGRVYLPLRDAWRRRKSILDLPRRGPWPRVTER